MSMMRVGLAGDALSVGFADAVVLGGAALTVAGTAGAAAGCVTIAVSVSDSSWVGV